MNRLPRWIDLIIIPAISLMLAMLFSGLAIWAIGEDPFNAFQIIFLRRRR